MKTDYETKEKTATAEPPKATALKKPVAQPTCILCGKANVAVKEFFTKGKAGTNVKVKQIICHEPNCRYVATYADGKLV